MAMNVRRVLISNLATAIHSPSSDWVHFKNSVDRRRPGTLEPQELGVAVVLGSIPPMRPTLSPRYPARRHSLCLGTGQGHVRKRDGLLETITTIAVSMNGRLDCSCKYPVGRPHPETLEPQVFGVDVILGSIPPMGPGWVQSDETGAVTRKRKEKTSTTRHWHNGNVIMNCQLYAVRVRRREEATTPGQGMHSPSVRPKYVRYLSNPGTVNDGDLGQLEFKVRRPQSNLVSELVTAMEMFIEPCDGDKNFESVVSTWVRSHPGPDTSGWGGRGSPSPTTGRD
ncbi:hypothetical protein OG21DRAFT_1521542 [Imleria badia]|nr:hypothetical protein OG21DRAFT_1521542 [Imleria badia]